MLSTYHKIRVRWLYLKFSQDPDSIGQFQGLVQHILPLDITLGNSKNIVILQLLGNSVWNEIDHLSQLMRLWYLSHRRPAKAQANLRIRAVLPEPSLFAHIKYGSKRSVRPKIRHLAHWMAAHAHLKNEFTEDEKYHNLMSWLNFLHSFYDEENSVS